MINSAQFIAHEFLNINSVVADFVVDRVYNWTRILHEKREKNGSFGRQIQK